MTWAVRWLHWKFCQHLRESVLLSRVRRSVNVPSDSSVTLSYLSAADLPHHTPRSILWTPHLFCIECSKQTRNRVTTCLENLEMSGNLKHVREMSGKKILSWKSVPKLFITRWIFAFIWVFSSIQLRKKCDRSCSKSRVHDCHLEVTMHIVVLKHPVTMWHLLLELGNHKLSYWTERVFFVMHLSHGKFVLTCTKFGQLVLRKIIEIVATRCQILRLKAPNSISAGALPQTLLGSLQHSPRLPSWI